MPSQFDAMRRALLGVLSSAALPMVSRAQGHDNESANGAVTPPAAHLAHATLTPVQRLKKWAVHAPTVLAACSPAPQVIRSAPFDWSIALGQFSGGEMLRGGSTLPTDVDPGLMTLYGFRAGVKGSQPGDASTDTGTVLNATSVRRVAWIFDNAHYLDGGYGLRETIGTATLSYAGAPAPSGGAVSFAIETTANLIGIVTGSGGAPGSVYGVVWDPVTAAWQELTASPPAPSTFGTGGIVYYALDGFPTLVGVSRRLVFQVSNGYGFGGLAMPAAASCKPLNLASQQVQVAQMGDSISFTQPNLFAAQDMGTAIGRHLGSFCVIRVGAGGTGYGQSSNAGSTWNLSLAGNTGVNSTGSLDYVSPDTTQTDIVIAAQPDIVVICSGANESMPAGSDLYGTQAAMQAVITQRLRGGLPNAVIVIVEGFVGFGSGSTDGASDGKYPAMRAAMDTVAAATAGPWIRINVTDNTWHGCNASGATFSGTTGAAGVWIDGISAGAMASTYTEGSAAPGSTAISYIYDGIHPTQFVMGTVDGNMTMTGQNDVIALNDASEFPAPVAPATSVPIAIMSPIGQLIDYASAVACTYSGRGPRAGDNGANFTLTGVQGFPPGKLVSGSRVLLPGVMQGADYYAWRIAMALKSAIAAL